MIQPFRDMAKLAEELEARSLASPPAKELSDEEKDKLANEIFDKHVAMHKGRFSEKYIQDLEASRWALTGHYQFAIKYAHKNGWIAVAKEDQTT